MTVPTLIQAVKFAFASFWPGGKNKGTVSSNPGAAIGLAEYVEGSPNFEKIKVWIQQQRTGIGKTLEVLVVLSLFKLLSDRSSVISTFTRAMRQSYLKELPVLNQILELTLHGIGVGRLYRPVVVKEYQSITPYFSPSKIASLEARISKGLPSTSVIAGIIQYFHAAIAHGDLPTFDDFFAQGYQLPPHTSTLHWCMCTSDKNNPLFNQIIDTNQDAREADILLITHAMLIRSNIARGKVLNTKISADETTTITFQLVFLLVTKPINCRQLLMKLLLQV